MGVVLALVRAAEPDLTPAGTQEEVYSSVEERSRHHLQTKNNEKNGKSATSANYGPQSRFLNFQEASAPRLECDHLHFDVSQ